MDGTDLERKGPLLLQCDDKRPNDDLKPLNELPRHADEDQVQLDVDRSFVYYPSGESLCLSCMIKLVY